LGIAEISPVMAHENGDALFAQAQNIGVLGLIGALHLIAERMQRFRNTAHADAPNAYKVHDTDGLRHLHGFSLRLNCSGDSPEEIASTRSASNAAALGRPTLRDASAIAASLSGMFMAISIMPRRRSGVSRSWVTISAPPTLSRAAAFAA